MKIVLIAPNPTFQTQDFEKQAQNRGFQVDRLRLPIINITNPKNDNFIKTLLTYNIVYFRNGADMVTKMILGKTIKKLGGIFINSGYYTNPLLSNKFFQMNICAENNIPVPKTLSLKIANPESFELIVNDIGQPFIIKPSHGAKGQGVNIIKNKEDYNKFIEKRSTFKNLIQEYIPNDGDYRVITVGHKAIGIFKRIPKKGDFRSNISLGGHGENVTDESLKPKLFNFAQKASKILNIEIGGFDFIRSKVDGQLYMIETNSIPQWEGFSKTTGINVAGKILDYFEQISQK